MAIRAIHLTGLSSITLPVTDALPTDPYILKEADGLGPPEVDIAIAETKNAGGLYQGRRPRDREVVFRVGLNPNHSTNQTAAELRQELYILLSSPNAMQIRIDSEYQESLSAAPPSLYTEGYLKRIEIVPFRKEPEVQITISCPSPYLHHETEQILVPTITGASAIFNNEGNAPSGFRVALTCTYGSNASFVLRQPGVPPQAKQLAVTHPVVAGDVIVFDTRPGRRIVSIKTYPATTVYTNITDKLTSDSEWFDVYPGENVIVADAISAAFPIVSWNEIRFWPQDWGV